MIRRAQPPDCAAVEAIVDAAYSPYVGRIGKPPGPMLDDYRALIAAGSVSVWIEPNGAIAGLAVLLAKPDHLLLDNVAVRPDRQGQGLGRRLIAFAETVENIALYQRLGFAETSRRYDAGYSRVFMTKRLPEPGQYFP